MAVVIQTNSCIVAGILRTNEHSHAYRPISGTSSCSWLVPEVDRVKLNDLSTAIFDRLDWSTRLILAFSGSTANSSATIHVYIESNNYTRPTLSYYSLLWVGKLNLFFLKCEFRLVKFELIRTSFIHLTCSGNWQQISFALYSQQRAIRPLKSPEITYLPALLVSYWAWTSTSQRCWLITNGLLSTGLQWFRCSLWWQWPFCGCWCDRLFFTFIIVTEQIYLQHDACQ